MTMADIKSPEERSRNMAKIRSKDTKPEEYIRKKLYSQGYRYRKNTSLIDGHPDLWLPRYNAAIFVNGCYWHRHEGCKYAYMPKSRVDFWKKKFQNNIDRDRRVKEELMEKGIRMAIIWECTIKNMRKSSTYETEIISKIDAFLKSENVFIEI